MTHHLYNETSLPQEIKARVRTHTNTHNIPLYLQHEIIRKVSRNHFTSDLYELNYIYKDSETTSLSTTITIAFSISLTRNYYLLSIRKQEHYPLNLSSNTTLYFIHRQKNRTEQPKWIFTQHYHTSKIYILLCNNNISNLDFPTEQWNICISTTCD